MSLRRLLLRAHHIEPYHPLSYFLVDKNLSFKPVGEISLASQKLLHLQCFCFRSINFNNTRMGVRRAEYCGVEAYLHMKSAPYFARPVTLSKPSGRLGRVPIYLNLFMSSSFAIRMLPSFLLLHLAQPL